MSSMNLLIADVIQVVSGTWQLTHKGMEQESNLSSSQSLAPGLYEYRLKINLAMSFRSQKN